MIAFYVLVIFTVFAIRLLLKHSIKMCKCKASMVGKVVIITGANSGIGYHTALELSRRGARLILACRDPERGQAACDSIAIKSGNKNVFFSQLNLSSLDSVRKFANRIFNTENQLDVLINNAGGYGKSAYTDDGIVEGMEVNYFGHFLLTLLLLPLLKKSNSARIVNLSSILHLLGEVDFDRMNEVGYNKVLIYCNSKLCNLVFSVELARRLKGTRVTANAVHPGVIRTGITEGETIARVFFSVWCWMCNRTVEQGAQTVLHAAISGECGRVTGKYFVDCAERFVLPRAMDERLATDLWNYSVKLVKYDGEFS